MFSAVTIVFTNYNGSGSAAYLSYNMKMILTTFLVKPFVTASVMAHSSLIIASPKNSLLGFYPTVRPLNRPRLCKRSCEPDIIITKGSMLTTLCMIIAMPTDCPLSSLKTLGRSHLAKRMNGFCRHSPNWPLLDTLRS